MMYKRFTLSAWLIGQALVAQALAQSEPALIPYGPLEPPAEVQKIVVKPRTIQLIDNALRDEKDLPRKTLLVRDLGLCPVPESAAILKRLLSDPHPLVRSGAVQSLVQMNAADETSLAPLVNDTSADVRREVVRARLPAAIVAGVKDQDPTVRVAALSVSVNEATDRAILDQLGAVDASMQAVALRTLGERKYTAAADAIAKLLDSDSVVVRVAAIDALAAVDALARTQVDQQLKHPHSAVRVAATRGASTLEEADRIAIARASLADKDLAVRAEAAKLDVYSDASFVDTYFAQLPLGYAPLRLAAREALVAIAVDNSEAKPRVTAGAVQRLTDPEADRRIDASYVLGRLKSREGLADHVALLKDANWHVVEQAARSLGPIGDASAGAELVAAALRSMDANAEIESGQMLARGTAGEQAVLSAVMLRHTPVVDATKGFYMKKDAPQGVRNAGIYAAGVLGNPEDTARALRPLLGRVTDPEESTQSIVEGIKALGNAGAKSMAGQLDKLRKDQTSVDFQYAAHVALDRINGTTTPFERTPVSQEPDTSIRAIDPAP